LLLNDLWQAVGELQPIQIGVLFVHTTPDLAYRFYQQREGGDISIVDFITLRHARVEAEVEEMIGLSHAVLYNWTGRSEYRRAVKAFIDSL